MKNPPVFVFGSFSAEEASAFQTAYPLETTNLKQLSGLRFGSFNSEIKDGKRTNEQNLSVTRDNLTSIDKQAYKGRQQSPKEKQSESKHGSGLSAALGNTKESEKVHTVADKNPQPMVVSQLPTDTAGSEHEGEINGKVADAVESQHVEKEVSEQFASLKLENGDNFDEAVEDPNSLPASIPLSWARKIGGKKDDGHLGSSHSSKYTGSKSYGTLPHSKLSNGKGDHISVNGFAPKAFEGTKQVKQKLQPRGLINPGNLCFLNSVLQAFLSCSPFVELLQSLKVHTIPEVGFPIIQAFVAFVKKFEEDTYAHQASKQNAKSNGVIEIGQAFNPLMFDTIVNNFSPEEQRFNGHGRTRQEDAQEFLSFVMDGMHHELLKLDKQEFSSSVNTNLSLVTSSEDDEWETVGPRNQTAVTRTQSFMESKLTRIFGGELRSVVKSRGNKASATIQPFLLLHLDICAESIYTVEDALRHYVSPESLDDYRVSSGKAGVVNARKSVKLQKLPKVLILHLVRFSYGSNGSSKLQKPIRFAPEIALGRDLLVSPTVEGRKYELVATVTHHGRDISRGHYTADAKFSDGKWLRFDDASVCVVGLNKVLHDQTYLLFYKQI
eukprot:TRINITY_DN11699_c0_g1_i1.p1 TRINITY_DN11699_c0_g1~~TRINITY_DN11699_c0_g1_i1.p1  ORF type:complete len:609 (-),score=128.46 TRINITY_DN11699_c0_g1_i1:109-1935(-)